MKELLFLVHICNCYRHTLNDLVDILMKDTLYKTSKSIKLLFVGSIYFGQNKACNLDFLSILIHKKQLE